MNITFVHECRGLMSLQIETDTVCVQIQATSTFPPFKELYTWLGRIRDRQLPVEMIIDEEGYGVKLKAKKSINTNQIEFSISDWTKQDDILFLKTEIEANALIKAFQNEIVDFITTQSHQPEPSFAVDYSCLNWNALLNVNTSPQNWDKRLAMYGGGKGKRKETNIDNFELSLEQEYLILLKNNLSYFTRLSFFYNRQQLQKLISLCQELIIDIALGTIDANWYKQKQTELNVEYQLDSHRQLSSRKEREQSYHLQQARLKTLQIGQVVDGSVFAIKAFGVFVNIGGIVTLLHISNISQLPVEHPKQIFQPNDWVRAIIVDMNIQKARISLATKHLEFNPGQMFEDPVLVYQNAITMAERYRNSLFS